MPVEDHPVHHKTIRTGGALWGCNTSRPGYTGRKSGYWAPDGYKMAQADDCGRKVVLPQMKWIEDTSSLECHIATRFDDPACKGCKKLLP